ncbi:hypothetical protein IID22_01710 [Patescibacteria group bacterium]|nr:hypothetical protein [Patescibacteria group bacterium]
MAKASKKVKSPSILKFRYSYPYEGSLLRLAGKKLSRKHSEICREKEKQAQKIWDKYEKKVISLFEEMYKIKINEKFIEVFISLIMPSSFSHPMTISLKRFDNLEESEKQQRGLVYTIIHELAHYFLYTRDKGEYVNGLWKKIRDKDLLGDNGTNLHFLIQAVEFGIIGEVFGDGYARYARNYVIEKFRPEYSKSAQTLIDHEVPLDKSCLTYIEKKILK